MFGRSGRNTVYDAVVFDCDGVLVRPTSGEVLAEGARAALDALGVEPTPRAIAHASSSDLGPARRLWTAHGLDPETFAATRDEYVSAAQVAAMRDGRKSAYEDLDALDRLADRGVETAVVSNNQQATIDAFVERAGLDVGFASGREPSVAGMRRKKPNPYYLRRALDDLGVAPSRALYVGDNRKDVLVARVVGADAAFVRRPHREAYRVGPTPDHDVDGLAALVGIAGPDDSS